MNDESKNGYTLLPHEFLMKMTPVGVGYRCEFCNEGEMIVVTDEIIISPLMLGETMMRPHQCTKCGKKLSLPKTYPYIEWIKEEVQ